MKFLQITSHFCRPVSITFASVRNRLPFSCSSSSHSHRQSYLPICGCKFYSLSNSVNPACPSEASLTPTSNLVQEFAKVLHNDDLLLVANHPVSVECQKRLQDLDDHQFLAILSNFDAFFQQKGSNFCGKPNENNPLNKLMLSLDSECCKRFADGDNYTRALSLLETHRFFLAVHHSKMIQRVLRRNCKTPFSAPKPLLHRYLAFMNQHRLWDKPFKFYWLEYALQARLDELDVPDICAFLQAYVVTLNRFISNDELLINIFAKFTNQLDSIHKSHLLTFLLFANRLMYLYQYATITPHVAKLLHFLNTNFEAYPLTCHINAAILSSKLLLYRPQYLQKICDAILKMPEISVDAFLNVSTAGDPQARTQPLDVVGTSLPSSSLGKVDNHSSCSSTIVSSQFNFSGTEMKNRPSEFSQPTNMVKEVTVSPVSVSVLKNEIQPSMVESDHSIPRSDSSMVSLFPYNKNTLLAMHIVNFTNTVAFFNCIDVAAQLKPFLESSPVRQYFLDASPKLYVSAITYLAFVGLFSHSISTFLSNEFLLKTFKRVNVFKIPRHIFYLDAAVQIECPNYHGDHLKPELRRKMDDFMIDHSPRKVHFVDKKTFQAIYKMYAYEAAAREYVLYKYTMDEAAALLGELFGGDDYTHVCRALPDLSGENLIWCMDAAGNPKKLSAEVKEGRVINFESIDLQQHRWFILVCSSLNIHDKEGVGPMVVYKEVPKVRQMKLLGFQVVEVVHEEWETMSRDQRISILKAKLGLSATE